MAAHVRTQLREAVAGVVTNLPMMGARVFQSRIYPLEDVELPALLVSTGDESITVETIGEPWQKRIVEVRIEAVAKATADLDDKLDQICKEVEVAIATSNIPMAKKVDLTRIETPIQPAEQPTGVATLTFEVEYWTADNAPDVAL